MCSAAASSAPAWAETVRIVDGEDTSDAIYTQPLIYDAAFSYRDFSEEVHFLQMAYSAHGGGAPLTTVVDLGCGPAQHVIALALEGVPRVLAVDINSDMRKYGAAKAAAVGADVTFVAADMRDFVLPAGVPPADLVLCLMGTFSHMLDNAAAQRCFGAAHRALRPGGLFILELSHPGDLFDGTFIVGDGGKEVWEVPIDPVTLVPTGAEAGSDSAAKLMVEWGAEFDAIDPVSQVLVRSVSMTVLEGDAVRQVLEATVPQRMFTVQELALLAQATGLQVVEMYGEMRMDVGLSHEDAYRLVAVLRRP